MMLVAVIVFAILLSTFSAIPAMCFPDAQPSTAPLPATQDITNTHQQATTLSPDNHFSSGNVLPSSNIISSLPVIRKNSQASDEQKTSMITSIDKLVPESKYRAHSLLAYVNYFKEMLKPYSSFNQRSQQNMTFNQTSLSSRLVKKYIKSGFFLHKKNHLSNISRLPPKLQYTLRRKQVLAHTHTSTHTDKVYQGKRVDESDRRQLEQEFYLVTKPNRHHMEEEQVSPRPASPKLSTYQAPADPPHTLNLKKKSLSHNTTDNQISNHSGIFPNVTTDSSRKIIFQRNLDVEDDTKIMLPLTDNSLTNDTDIINEYESNGLCTEDINKVCIFKRSAKLQSLQNQSKPIGSQMAVNQEYSGDSALGRVSLNLTRYRSKNISHNTPKRRKEDGGSQQWHKKTSLLENRGYNNNPKRNGSYLSSTTDNRQSNTSSHGSTTNSDTETRQHKRSSRSQTEGKEPGRLTRRNNRRRGRDKRRDRRNKGLSLWLDSKQVKTFSGYIMEIFVIHNSRVLPYILDPKFEGQLPVIPAQVESVNFTWRTGSKKYHYTFDYLYSQDEGMLAVPVLSLPPWGRVPRRPRVFSVEMRCTGNASGITTFGIGLALHTQQGQPLPGTPLRLRLRKECNYMGPDPECDEKCDNGGVCDEGQRCVCAEGFLGPFCAAALCYPRCMNGGTCTSPGRCSCPPGFNGRHCEGGICQHKCQNGGKCVQKDTCECRRGYYGNQCEFSKCVIPCVNGGRCRDVNKCRCPHGFTGDHCEVMLSPRPPPPSVSSTPARCRRRCRHGSCHHDATCHCHHGYTGRWCRRRGGRGSGKKKVWV